VNLFFRAIRRSLFENLPEHPVRPGRRPALRCAVAALCAVSTLVTPACADPPGRTSIVLIVVDTLRADHMSLYGYDRPTTPNLEELAGQGVVYERAFATAPWTMPSVASIVTGLLPSTHGAGRTYFDDQGRQQAAGMHPEIRTVMQRLQEAGYATHGIGNAIYVNAGWGFDRGLDSYDWRGASDSDVRTADVTADLALDWIDQHRDEPFFLFVHMFDPHRHFDAPEPFRGIFTDAFVDTYGDTLATRESRLMAEENVDWPFIVAAYDEEIAFVDEHVGRLLRGLRQRELIDDGLVIMTADHGEGMYEHDAPGHGGTLYEEVMRVPLVVWGGGVLSGRRLDPVSTVDIAPTILAAAGIPWRHFEQPLHGIDLWPSLEEDEPVPVRMIFAERSFGPDQQLKAVVRWPYKAIVGIDGGDPELYDLENDPDELEDLWGSRSDDFYHFLSAVQQLVRAEEARDPEFQTIDPETLKTLRALGYVR